MKVLAKDLKHGQRFRRSSEDAIAAGLVDSDGCAIAIHAVAKRTLFIPGYIEVELIDPPAEPTYRPYTDAELLEQLGAKVRLKSKDRSHGRLIAGVDLGTAVIGLERVSAEALRNKYEHLDGTPCGVEE